MSERPYLSLLRQVRDHGELRTDRTGVGTYELFGRHLSFNLRDGFPLLTTKKMQWKSIVGELLWFISGSVDAHELRDKYGVNIWLPWADVDGHLGPVYGYQLRRQAGAVDQLDDAIDQLKRAPHSRRHIISLWDAMDLPEMNLPPCHGLVIQFHVDQEGGLSCQMYQRSADMFLGLPFNIASYALLTHMVAAQTGLHPKRLHICLGSAHIYRNHMGQVNTQLSRKILPGPELGLNANVDHIDDYTPEDINLIGYECHDAIHAEVAV